MKHLLLTFDYEIFLGRASGTVRRSLLEPTRALQEILEDRALRGIFFVDALHLARLEEVAPAHAAARDDLDAMRAQLRSLAERGHEIFLHLHPHWMDARYIPATNTWDLGLLANYRFGSLDAAERPRVFALGADALRRALGDMAGSMPFDGYRAGGWCIQPFEAFAAPFAAHGIHFDFSVLPGAVAWTTGPRFDFRVAEGATVHRFSSDPATADPSGPFTELCITRLPWSGWRARAERQLLRVLRRAGTGRCLGDGVGARMDREPGGPEDAHPERQMASAELLTAMRAPSYARHLETADYMQLISHPKMQRAHSLRAFAGFLDRACRRFAPSSDFRSLP